MSVAQKKTPGVYIVEENAFPNSVVEVPTGIPVFIGYTEKAHRGDDDLKNVPTRISSFDQYVEIFGGAPQTIIKTADGGKTLPLDPNTRFLMYKGVQLFYLNGGGDCWIVSVGGYVDGTDPQAKSADDLIGPLHELEKILEPAIIHAPDSVLLDEGSDNAANWAKVSQQYLLHCGELQSRVAILDVVRGDQPRTFDEKDPISADGYFRGQLGAAAFKNYGMAYYPWVNTSVLELEDISLLNMDETVKNVMAAKITALQVPVADDDPSSSAKSTRVRNKALSDLADKVKAAPPDKPAADAGADDVKAYETAIAELEEANKKALVVSADYKRIMDNAVALLNKVPPGAGMAGVYARTDDNFGVFRAPANMGMLSVVSPSLEISSSQQEDLNAPLDGMAVNAIRTFVGRGTLIWGARTLDANSLDWRYINVRRTMIMLEQSIKAAAEAYVFAPNDSTTWVSVKSMIENFLTNQWKAGALAGAKAADAFDVSVGLGSTMTSVDILEGYMRITVRVAVVRPAEFIVIIFRQKMQTS